MSNYKWYPPFKEKKNIEPNLSITVPFEIKNTKILFGMCISHTSILAVPSFMPNAKSHMVYSCWSGGACQILPLGCPCGFWRHCWRCYNPAIAETIFANESCWHTVSFNQHNLQTSIKTSIFQQLSFMQSADFNIHSQVSSKDSVAKILSFTTIFPSTYVLFNSLFMYFKYFTNHKYP